MKVFILGTGFVAQAFSRACKKLGLVHFTVSRRDCDYTQRSALVNIVANAGLIVNAAGFVGEFVDQCEHKTETFQGNTIFPALLAKECSRFNRHVLHVSTGCFFNGDGNFTEEQEPNFLENHYLWSKWIAEQLVLQSGAPALVLRIRMPFSAAPHYRNLIDKLLGYPRILPGKNSLTDIDQCAEYALLCAQKGATGVFNAVQPGSIDIADIAEQARSLGLRGPYDLWTKQEFLKFYIPRSETTLNPSKFEATCGLSLSPVHEAITAALTRRR